MKKLLAALGAAAIVLAAAGCGDDEAKTTTVTAAAATTPAPEPALPEGPDAGSAAEAATEPADEPQDEDAAQESSKDAAQESSDDASALAGTDTTIAGAQMRIEVVELVRQDELATLTFTVENTSGRDSEIFYHAFDDTGRGTAADGLVLIDPRNGREYKVVRRPGTGCLCSDELPFKLGAGQKINLSATFEAPSPDVEEANVNFPGSVGQLTGIPISG